MQERVIRLRRDQWKRGPSQEWRDRREALGQTEKLIKELAQARSLEERIIDAILDVGSFSP